MAAVVEVKQDGHHLPREAQRRLEKPAFDGMMMALT